MHVLDGRTRTEADVRAIVEKVSFAPNLRAILGVQDKLRIVSLARADGWMEIVPGGKVVPALEGWLVEWFFKKPDVNALPNPNSPEGRVFHYCLGVFVPTLIQERRVLEIVMEKFRFFLEHELREGFVYDGGRPFDPHKEVSA